MIQKYIYLLNNSHYRITNIPKAVNPVIKTMENFQKPCASFKSIKLKATSITFAKEMTIIAVTSQKLRYSSNFESAAVNPVKRIRDRKVKDNGFFTKQTFLTIIILLFIDQSCLKQAVEMPKNIPILYEL